MNVASILKLSLKLPKNQRTQTLLILVNHLKKKNEKQKKSKIIDNLFFSVKANEHNKSKRNLWYNMGIISIEKN